MAFDHAGTLEAVDDVLLVGQKQAIEEARDGYAEEVVYGDLKVKEPRDALQEGRRWRY